MNTIIGLDKKKTVPYETVGGIPNGQAFIGKVGNSKEELFIKTYSGAAGLRDPGDLFWGNVARVEAFQPVDLKIEVL